MPYLTIGNETVLSRIRLTIHEITKRRSLKAPRADASIAYRIRVRFTIGDVPFYSNLTFMRARVCAVKNVGSAFAANYYSRWEEFVRNYGLPRFHPGENWGSNFYTRQLSMTAIPSKLADFARIFMYKLSLRQ